MVKGLLSDFYKVIQPSYQPDTFQPYLSLILTVVTFTIVAYSFQVFTTEIHIYAQNPLAFQTNVLDSENCSIFSKGSIRYLCRGLTDSDSINYTPRSLLSFEQDLHNPIK